MTDFILKRQGQLIDLADSFCYGAVPSRLISMSKNTQPKSFENALSELESLVSQMEAGQLPLEQAVAAYQRGSELLHYCQKTLVTAEQQVRILSENNTLQAYIDPNQD
jgi:exodeoxyribonuclease VII small subunit